MCIGYQNWLTLCNEWGGHVVLTGIVHLCYFRRWMRIRNDSFGMTVYYIYKYVCACLYLYIYLYCYYHIINNIFIIAIIIIIIIILLRARA